MALIFLIKFFDLVLSHTGASALAIKLAVSWQARIQVIAVKFRQLQHLIPDPMDEASDYTVQTIGSGISLKPDFIYK